MATGDNRPTVSIDDWLKVSRDNSTLDQVDKSPPAHGPGLATSLYNLCSQQLSRLAVAWPSSCKSASDKRRRARLANIRSKLAAFGDSFDDGKLESCLNADNELHTSILTLLHDIGSLLQRDIVTNLVDLRASIASAGDVEDSTDIDKASERPSGVVSDWPSAAKQSPDKSSRSSKPTASSFQPVDATVTSLLRQVVTQARAVLDESDTDGEASSSTENESTSNGAHAEHNVTAHFLRPLTSYINLLMDLCPTLEQTYNDMHKGGSRRPQKLLQNTISVTQAAMPYVTNVQDKFPRAIQELVRRLGEANWQRHERLRAIQTLGPSSEPVAFKDAKSLFRPVSQFQDSALGSSIRTQSQRAESNASHSSFISSSAAPEKGHFRVPGLPNGASYGESFACPYCSTTVSKIQNRIDWKMHVFGDLNAYICTSSGCSLDTFPSRKLWYEHEKNAHLTVSTLRCQLCAEAFEKPDAFLQHAQSDHKMTLDTDNLKTAALSVATVAQLKHADSLTCPLCLESGWSKHREYSTHLGRHLEEVALAALPPGDEEEEEDADSDQEIASAASSIGQANREFGSVLKEDHQRQKRTDTIPSPLEEAEVVTDVDSDDTDLSSGVRPLPSSAERGYSPEPSNPTRTELEKLQQLEEAFDRKEKQNSQEVKDFEAELTRKEKPYVCSICQKEYRSPSLLERHKKFHPNDDKRHTNHHTGGCTYGCLICGQSYSSADALANHKERRHRGTGWGASRESFNANGEARTPDFPTHHLAIASTAEEALDPSKMERSDRQFTPEFSRNDRQRGDVTPLKLAPPNTDPSVVTPHELREIRTAEKTSTQEDQLFEEMTGIRPVPVNPFPENHRQVKPESPLPPYSEQNQSMQEEEEYTIKCVCKYADDDGNTVYCPKCDSWQHIVCYYPGWQVPDDHFCVDCFPRDVDGNKATELQRRQRERVEAENRKPKRSRPKKQETINVSKDSGYLSDPGQQMAQGDFPRKPSDSFWHGSGLTLKDERGLNTPMGKLQNLADAFHKNWLSDCYNFISACYNFISEPPSLLEVHAHKYKVLKEILSKIFLEIDRVEADSAQSRQLKYEFVREVGDMDEKLDTAFRHVEPTLQATSDSRGPRRAAVPTIGEAEHVPLVDITNRRPRRAPAATFGGGSSQHDPSPPITRASNRAIQKQQGSIDADMDSPDLNNGDVLDGQGSSFTDHFDREMAGSIQEDQLERVRGKDGTEVREYWEPRRSPPSQFNSHTAVDDAPSRQGGTLTPQQIQRRARSRYSQRGFREPEKSPFKEGSSFQPRGKITEQLPSFAPKAVSFELLDANQMPNLTVRQFSLSVDFHDEYSTISWRIHDLINQLGGQVTAVAFYDALGNTISPCYENVDHGSTVYFSVWTSECRAA